MNDHSKPMTLSGLDKETTERVNRISDEFRDGFNFIKECDKSVTFFGSARTPGNHPEFKHAKALAEKISKETGYGIVTGGGPGIMAAANCGAANARGRSYGLTIQLPFEQITNTCVSHHMDFYYFFSRKVCLAFAAEAYVYFPGGFGTLDELFEILTLVQTGKIEKVPIILFGNEYWKDLDSYIKKHLLGGDKISEGDIDLYTITEDYEEIVQLIKAAPIRKS